MDNQRLLVWGAFLMLAWFTWQQWNEDYGPGPVEAQPPSEAVELEPVEDELPTLSDPVDDTADTMPTIAGEAEHVVA